MEIAKMWAEEAATMTRRARPRCRVSKVHGDPHGRWYVSMPPGNCPDVMWYAMSLPEAMDLAVRLHRKRFA